LKNLATLEEKRKKIYEALDKHLVPVGTETYSFYKLPPFEPLQQRRHHKVISSLLEMRKELQTWRSLGIGSLIAFFTLTVSLLAFGANLYRQNSDLIRQVAEGKNDLQEARHNISNLQADVERLSSDLKQVHLDAALADSGKQRKKSP